MLIQSSSKRRAALIGTVLALAALSLSACGSSKKSEAIATTPTAVPKVVTQVASSTIQDHGYNQLAFDGLTQELGKINGTLKTVESTSPNANQADLTAASKVSDLVFVSDPFMADVLLRVAAQNPKVKYTLLDNDFANAVPANVQYDVFASQEASYLAGIVAAGVSKTGTIGFVGGMDFPVLEQFLAGFEAGAKSANPKIKISVVWTGSFTDQAKGKEAANAQIARGVDVIYQVAGGTGTGVIAAAQAAGIYAIGVNVDQNSLAPDTVITSVVKGVDVAAIRNVQDLAADKWVGGRQIYNLANNGVGLAPFHSLDSKVSAATKALVTKAIADISSGAIVVPITPSTK